MRKYNKSMELEKLICNNCGKELKVTEGILREGCFSIDYPWGYFSSMDGMKHRFDLCEECYQKMTAQFLIAPEESETTEIL